MTGTAADTPLPVRDQPLARFEKKIQTTLARVWGEDEGEDHPGLEGAPKAHVYSPRLAHPEQAGDFAKQVIEVSA